MRGCHVHAPLLSREAQTVKNSRRGRRHSAFREQVRGAREGNFGKDAYVSAPSRLDA